MHLIDAFTAQHAGKDLETSKSGWRAERRHRHRTPVHWPLALFRDGASTPIETVTQNLSSTGLYCLSPVPLTPGEKLRCALRVPAYDPHDEERHIIVECTALLVRAEAAADGFFGVACHIEEYHLACDDRAKL